MFMSEEELPVKVAEVDGIEIDNVDFAEAAEDEVLEELAADAASAYQEHAGLDKDSRRQTESSIVAVASQLHPVTLQAGLTCRMELVTSAPRERLIELARMVAGAISVAIRGSGGRWI